MPSCPPLANTVPDIAGRGGARILAAAALALLAVPALAGPTSGPPPLANAVSPPGAVRIERLATLGGHPAAKAVAIDGGDLYVGFGRRLVISAAAGDQPKVVRGSIELAGDILALVGRWPYVYALTTSAVFAVDGSQPDRPVLTATIAIESTSQGDVAFSGDSLFVGSADGLRVLSTQDPQRPRIMAHLPNYSFVTDLSLREGRLALTTSNMYSDGSLYLLDIRNPTAPIEQVRLPLPETPGLSSGARIDVALRDDGLAVVTTVLDYQTWLLVADVQPGRAARWLDDRRWPLGRGEAFVGLAGNLVYAATFAGVMRVELTRDGPLSAPAWWPIEGDFAHGLAVEEDDLFVATGRGVFHVFDFSFRGSEGATVIATRPVGAADTARVAVAGNRAYVSGSKPGTVDVLDLSDEASIQALGTLAGLPAASSLAAFESSLLVASPDATLRRVDAADVTRPRVTWTLTGTLLSDLAMGPNDILFGASPNDGLVAVDPRDEAAPRVLARLRLAADAPGAGQILVAGTRAYLLGEALGLAIVDIQDPEAPRLLGRLNPLGVRPLGLALANEALAIAHPGGILLVDVDDAAHPALLARFALPAALGTALDVLAIGHEVHVACTGGQDWAADGVIASIDVAQWARPALLSATALPARHLVPLYDEEALVVGADTDGMGTLRRIRLAHAVHYMPRPGLTQAGGGKDVVLRDGIALVAAGSQGLYVVDVSDPAQPRRLATLSEGIATHEVALDGSRAYALTAAGLTVLDMPAAGAPTVRGSYPIGGAVAMAVRAGRMYLITSPPQPALPPEPVVWDLVVWDVAGTGAPTRLGSLSLGDVWSPTGLAVDDQLAYVTTYDGELILVHIAEPARPSVAGRITLGAGAWDVANAGGRALVMVAAGNGDSTLTTVDVSDPTRPRVSAALAFDDGINYFGRLVVDGTRAWLSDPWRGVSLVDVSEPDRLRLLATYWPPEASAAAVMFRAVAADGDRAYLATDDSILWSLGLTDARCLGRCLYLPTLRQP